MYLVGDGVLWSRVSHRSGQIHKVKITERRLDSLRLSGGVEGKWVAEGVVTEGVIIESCKYGPTTVLMLNK